MDLYLHIGTEKTGTSAIQRFLARNRSLLRNNGILFPASPGDENQKALPAIGEDRNRESELRRLFQIEDDEAFGQFRRRLREGLERELQTGTCTKAVITSEHCSSRLKTAAEVQSLFEFFRGLFDKIHIVVYLRRQDDYLLSTYSTSIKAGSTKPLAFPKPGKIRIQYGYFDLLSRWSSAFGRDQIICRKFERGTFAGGDIVADFLTAIGIDMDPSYERAIPRNESLDADGLEFLRLFNHHFKRTDHRGAIVRALADISKGSLLSLPDEVLAEFMASFADGNRKIAIEYFGGPIEGLGDPLFGPRTDSRPRRVYEPMSTERAVEIAAALLQHRSAPTIVPEEIHRQRERLPKEERKALQLARQKAKEARRIGANGDLSE